MLDNDLELLKNSYLELSEKRLKILSGDYRKTKKIIKSLYISDVDIQNDKIMDDLDELIICNDFRNVIRESKSVALSLFGSAWSNENTDPQSLHDISNWLLEFRGKLNEKKLSSETIDVICNGIDVEKVQNEVKQIQEHVESFLNTFHNLYNYLKMDTPKIFKPDLSKASFNEIKNQIQIFDNGLNKLPLWSQFLLRKREMPPITKGLIPLIEEDVVDPDDLIPILEGNFADSILKEVFLEEPSLRIFIADLHENKIKKFRMLDKQLLKINQKRIQQKISEERPNMYSSSHNSELGILQGEFNRKRRHMPLRQLFNLAGGLIQTIKPCFLMSPLSIAQFIDPESVSNQFFDVIIFDEASQVKPEDALGALLRGKQLVVMGDTKQLPPTSFFDQMIQPTEDSEYEMDVLVDMESILHLCKRSFDTKMLRWHYRSRHESLIAVSNQEFYDNYLFIYPSPNHDSEALGLQFKYINDGIYDRGGSSANIKEAKAVVEASFKHYKEYGHKKSLGIGTFNMRQQQAILEVLEVELKRNPGMEEYFSSIKEEHFFVKNLETIQGDERDVILVSVGFGFDNDHKLNQNFGPLNKDGGERRLNVLVTRAKEKCVVFSNFKYSDLRVGEESPFGLRALKVFLEYAETRQLVSINTRGEDFDSPFEESVYDLITSFGYEVHKQVGCAGYRIDLAVVDPQSPGKYLIGIECDGAMYHSSPVARDRDRLRQQVLEGLGWQIYRIWSTEWYQNRPASIKRLLKAIEESKNPKIIIDEMEEDVEELEIEEEIIESSEIIPQTISLEDSIPQYEICNSLNINKNCELHEKSPYELSMAIIQIVDLESPIHITEVVRRIRTYWGLKRAGKRIQDTILQSALLAKQNGNIDMKNDFLYSKTNEIRVRMRNKDFPANIDLISTDEINQAIKMIIDIQFATNTNDLVTQVSRLFGFRSTSKKTAQKINEAINNLLIEKELVELNNGMINFPKNN